MKLLFVFILLFSIHSTSQNAKVTDVEVSFLFVEKDVDGTISGIDVQSDMSLSDFTKSTIKGTAEVETLDTDNFLRDGHLMWEKYFNEDDYPLIKFHSQSISQLTNDRYKIIADLTIKGITRTVEAFAKIKNDEIVITSTIYTSDWEINIKDEREENKLEVTIDIQLN